jgi:hypothetical protein
MPIGIDNIHTIISLQQYESWIYNKKFSVGHHTIDGIGGKLTYALLGLDFFDANSIKLLRIAYSKIIRLV